MTYLNSRGAIEDHVFAAYGRAMHRAQALEYWLRVLVATHRTAAKEFNSQEQLERTVAILSVSTMGTIFASLRNLVRDDALEAQLTQAVAERNWLAHQYFGHWNENWTGFDSDIQMIVDAERIRTIFDTTVARLTTLIGGHLDAIGEDPDSFLPGLGERIRLQMEADAHD